MTILINVSDLAAMGASPIGIVVSTVMPDDMHVRDYNRYLDGLVEAADEFDCPVIGGNIKDGSEFTSTGAAFGSAPSANVMHRTGARAGDRICVIGRMGLFWGAVLQRLSPEWPDTSHASTSALRQALYRPTARLRESQVLAQSGLVTACMDASDGIGACLTELAIRNCVDIVVDDDSLVPDQAVSEITSKVSMDPRKLMLAWGNWELVFSVAPTSLERLQGLALIHELPLSVIGEMRNGDGTVWLSSARGVSRLTNFASERFTGTSYFTHGLKSYMQWLMEVPITH